MHVKSLARNIGTASSEEISLNFNRLCNSGGIDNDYFYSTIDSGLYYIGAGFSASDLSSLTGGNVCQDTYDFVIVKFGD